MRITFWGVRGSIPSSESQAWRYGGNTPCLELRSGDHLFILDAGTGIRDLGRQLLAELPSDGIQAQLFLTHYHWDHIQGLPFFEPLYFAGNNFQIFGPRFQTGEPFGLNDVLKTLFHPPYFPVGVDQLQAGRTLHDLDWKSDFIIGTTRIRTCRLNHPQGSMAYRFDDGGASVVYATDHEPGNPEFDRNLRELARDADLLISDAQYRPEELGAQKAGWGHGSWKAAVTFARDAGVKNVVLFHHEPIRTDLEIDDLVFQARRIFPRTWAAAERMLLDVTHRLFRVGSRATRLSQRTPVGIPIQIETSQNGSRVREEVRLENVSLQGAYFLSPRPYELQQPVELGVRLPPSDKGNGRPAPEPFDLRLRGYVLRAEPQTTNGGWVGVALHFPDEQPKRSAPKAGTKPAPPPRADAD